MTTTTLQRVALPAGLAAGLAAIAWVGAGYLHDHRLALAVTVLIGAVFVAGMAELWRFDRDSARLQQALAALHEPPAVLADWLTPVPDALRAAVRLRVDGQRLPLPGPAMTPYLVGLLVLLGMLGTFLGMVVTLQGTGLALQRATDLVSMRDSLAAPVKGLGLAFGTSVAGVAASALLGLMSALCRRQRLQVAQQLDAAIAGPLQGFSQAQRREAAQARLHAQLQQAADRAHEQSRQLAEQVQQQAAQITTLLQQHTQQGADLARQQTQWLPALADRLQATMDRLDAQARHTGDQLLASQAQAQQHTEAAFQGLATAVGQSLQHSLADGARRAADTLGPAVQATLDGLAQQAQSLHAQLGDHTRRQVDALAAAVDARAAALLQSLAERQAAQGEALAATVAGRLDTAAARLDGAAQALGSAWQAAAERHEQQAADRDAQRLAAWQQALSGTAAALQQGWQQATAGQADAQARLLQALEASADRIGTQAEAQARATVAEVARLVHSAAEAPRAAADVVAQLREQLSDSLARDQAMLAERARVLATLDTVLEAVRHNAGAQKAAIDNLVASTADWLAQASSRFDDRVDAQSARLDALAGQLGESATEVASLGQALSVAVEGFARAGEALTGHLQRLDDSLGQVMTRSDEQLAYYVAQAREVIDLSLSAQQQIVADLQRVAAGRLAPADA